VSLDLVLRERNLVLDRVVLLVRLHVHRLVAEFREASLVQHDVLLDVPAGGRVLRDALPGAGHLLPCLVEAGIERLDARRFVGQPVF
jgi:hypothetical protein